MAKKRIKHPRLPNGYGSIKWLGKGRRNPYGVYPPVKEFTLNGIPVSQKALCYTDNWMKGFAVLTAYNAGTYYQGMENDLHDVPTGKAENELVDSILADYGRLRRSATEAEEKEEGKTFAEVYKDFYHDKFDSEHAKPLSQSSRASARSAFRNCANLHDREFRSLRHDDLQSTIDSCPLKKASKDLMVLLLHQMYSYAEIHELCDKNYSAHIKVKAADEQEHGIPFTDADLKCMWNHSDNPTIEFLLIMCYSGFRISAYKTLTVNLSQNYFQGGIKTAAGKERIVPIHSAILPLVKRRIRQNGHILSVTPSAFRKSMYAALNELNLDYHTPHDCRHTFSRLCEKYGVAENDRKRMLGHSFGADITNGVYGHRELEDLRAEIEKIQIP